MTRAAFIHSSELEKYHYPPECPLKTERAGALLRKLTSMGLLGDPDRLVVAPGPADRSVLGRFHTGEYLDALQRASNGHSGGYVDMLVAGLGTLDTPIFGGMYEYAALAAGASLRGAELILAGDADVAFNPSGGYHHGHASQAAGFCYINDVVLACMALTDAGKRVLVLDIDAHHCDGVQEAFYERSDVLTLSFHEYGPGFFPGTGAVEDVGLGAGRGCSVNVPLPAGTDDEMFARAFGAVALPVIDKFSPDVIVLELGMDCLAGDPLTSILLTNNAYADAVGRVLEFSLPVLAVGGGGYHAENAVRGWALAWSVLVGEADDTDDPSIGMGGLRDRKLAPDDGLRGAIVPALDAVIEKITANVFPLIGLTS